MALRVGNKFETVTGDIDDFQRCKSNRCTIKTDRVLGALESLGNGFGDTKSPERQGFCAKISDNAPPERLPRRYAYISFGTVPRVPMSTYKERFRVFPCGALFRV